MAINTVSNPVCLVDTNAYSMFGYPVPDNVTALEVFTRLDDDTRVVRWKSKGSKEIFSMDMPVITDETILAVLAAMRLSC